MILVGPAVRIQVFVLNVDPGRPVVLVGSALGRGEHGHSYSIAVLGVGIARDHLYLAQRIEVGVIADQIAFRLVDFHAVEDIVVALRAIAVGANFGSLVAIALRGKLPGKLLRISIHCTRNQRREQRKIPPVVGDIFNGSGIQSGRRHGVFGIEQRLQIALYLDHGGRLANCQFAVDLHNGALLQRERRKHLGVESLLLHLYLVFADPQKPDGVKPRGVRDG